MVVHNQHAEKWKVTVVDTGLNTMTGGRVRRIKRFVENEPFFLTYGDAVSDVNIKDLFEYHKGHGKCVTLTSVSLGQQKGVLDIDTEGTISAFREKEDSDSAVINGGYMVCNPEVFNYLKGDDTVFEKEPMKELAAEVQNGSCSAFQHQRCEEKSRNPPSGISIRYSPERCKPRAAEYDH